jgi:hypothetical protein
LEIVLPGTKLAAGFCGKADVIDRWGRGCEDEDVDKGDERITEFAGMCVP